MSRNLFKPSESLRKTKRSKSITTENTIQQWPTTIKERERYLKSSTMRYRTTKSCNTKIHAHYTTKNLFWTKNANQRKQNDIYPRPAEKKKYHTHCTWNERMTQNPQKENKETSSKKTYNNRNYNITTAATETKHINL